MRNAGMLEDTNKIYFKRRLYDQYASGWRQGTHMATQLKTPAASGQSYSKKICHDDKPEI